MEVLYPAERILVPGAVRKFDLRDGQVEAIVYAASLGIRGLHGRGRHWAYRLGKVRRVYPHIDGVPVVAAWCVAEEHRPAIVHWNVAGRGETAPASNYFSHHRFLHHFGVEMVLLFPLRHSTNENHQLERTVLFEAVPG